MNGKLVGLMGVVFLVVVLLGSITFAQDIPQYIVGIDGDYFPFTFIDKDGNPDGFDVDSIKWIADEMGFEVDIVAVAWDGIIPNLVAKNIDLIYSGMTITEERAQVVNFSDVYWVVNQAVAARAGEEKTIEGFLAGEYIVGTQRGCTAAMWVEDNLVNEGILPRANLMLFDNFPLAVQDLLSGRVETAIMDEPVVAKAIKDQPLEKIGIIATGEAYGIAVRQEDTELLETLNEGLARLMASPKWDELMDKWEMR